MPKRKRKMRKAGAGVRVLDIFEKRAKLRPINAVMLARIPLFPPIQKRTKTTKIQEWVKEYKYSPHNQEFETTVYVENRKALTYTHKRLFDSLLISAISVYKKENKTEMMLNPYTLKKMAGLSVSTRNVYLFDLLEDLQTLTIKILIKQKDNKKRKISLVPVGSIDSGDIFDDTIVKTRINPKDRGEFLIVELQERFVKFMRSKVVYSLHPSVLQKLHTTVNNPYLDYAIKFLLTQSKKERFELFDLLEKVIMQEKIGKDTKKKNKKRHPYSRK